MILRVRVRVRARARALVRARLRVRVSDFRSIMNAVQALFTLTRTLIVPLSLSPLDPATM